MNRPQNSDIKQVGTSENGKKILDRLTKKTIDGNHNPDRMFKETNAAFKFAIALAIKMNLEPIESRFSTSWASEALDADGRLSWLILSKYPDEAPFRLSQSLGEAGLQFIESSLNSGAKFIDLVQS